MKVEGRRCDSRFMMDLQNCKKRRNIAILGSTGSIGTQALDVVRGMGLHVTALCANRSIE